MHDKQPGRSGNSRGPVDLNGHQGGPFVPALLPMRSANVPEHWSLRRQGSMISPAAMSDLQHLNRGHSPNARTIFQKIFCFCRL